MIPAGMGGGQAVAGADQIADQGLRVDGLKIGDQKRFGGEIGGGQADGDDAAFRIAAGADLACRGAAGHRRVAEGGGDPGGQVGRHRLGRQEQHHQREGAGAKRTRQTVEGGRVRRLGMGARDQVATFSGFRVHSSPPPKAREVRRGSCSLARGWQSLPAWPEAPPGSGFAHPACA